MLSVIQRSSETVAHYSREAARLVAQFERENPDEQRREPLIHTAEWFLNCHGVWAESSIRIFALALAQEIEGMLEYDSFPADSREGQLLWHLKYDRPASVKKVAKSKKGEVAHQKTVATKKRKAGTKKRRKRRKSLPMKELRSLVTYFRSRRDEFSHWIAGYVMIASRLGWRPGEIVNLQREGSLLRAAAEKRTNNRGLTDACEIGIDAYIEKACLIKSVSLASELDRWIADARRWEAHYGGLAKLLDNINGRLATASKNCAIRRVCSYTFRHFAISCMKASKFSCQEIAVIINHASDRTATEHYGKRQHGVKRPKKILCFDRLRLLLVRNQVRSFSRPAVSAEAPSMDEMHQTRELEKADEKLAVETGSVWQFSC
jgi:integrase